MKMPRYFGLLPAIPGYVAELKKHRLPTFRAMLLHKMSVIHSFMGSRPQVAELLQVNPKTVKRWVEHRSFPLASTLARLDKAYDLAIEMLVIHKRQKMSPTRKQNRFALKSAMGQTAGLTFGTVSAHNRYYGNNVQEIAKAEPSAAMAGQNARQGLVPEMRKESTTR